MLKAGIAPGTAAEGGNRIARMVYVKKIEAIYIHIYIII